MGRPPASPAPPRRGPSRGAGRRRRLGITGMELLVERLRWIAWVLAPAVPAPDLVPEVDRECGSGQLDRALQVLRPPPVDRAERFGGLDTGVERPLVDHPAEERRPGGAPDSGPVLVAPRALAAIDAQLVAGRDLEDAAGVEHTSLPAPLGGENALGNEVEGPQADDVGVGPPAAALVQQPVAKEVREGGHAAAGGVAVAEDGARRQHLRGGTQLGAGGE